MVTPNVCNDGHDATCIGLNAEGGHAGGLVGADLGLKHWMPLILNSPAYSSGQMLVVVTVDEAGVDASVGEEVGLPLHHAPLERTADARAAVESAASARC